MAASPKRILIVGPAWVGDTIMAHSLLQFLKGQHPNSIIDMLAPAWTIELTKRMPEIHTAILLPFHHGNGQWRQRYQLGKHLRTHHYTQAIILPNSFKSALIPWFARIPVRTGWHGEQRYILLNDRRRPYSSFLTVERFLALGLPPNAPLPVRYPWPTLTISPPDQLTVLRKYHLARAPSSPLLALCIGAAFGPAKQWPASYFATIATQKIAEGWQIWLFGSIHDQTTAQAIMHLTQQHCTNLTGLLNLTETIDLLALATLVITHDSGLMHMAAALNKPLIALYGPTSPAMTPPLSKKARILQRSLACQPCFARICPLRHHQCMNTLSPALVFQAIESILTGHG